MSTAPATVNWLQLLPYRPDRTWQAPGLPLLVLPTQVAQLDGSLLMRAIADMIGAMGRAGGWDELSLMVHLDRQGLLGDPSWSEPDLTRMLAASMPLRTRMAPVYRLLPSPTSRITPAALAQAENQDLDGIIQALEAL
jgi:hypothetical protein